MLPTNTKYPFKVITIIISFTSPTFDRLQNPFEARLLKTM